MRMLMPVAILLAACGQDPEPFDFDRRRAALGLEDTPLVLKAVMRRVDALDAEAVLVSARRADRLRDLGLRIENLLGRATGELAPDVREARVAAMQLARTPTPKSARRLLEVCTACHVKHREER